jgi:hypothetical protein
MGRFKPLTLDLVEEGRFQEEIDNALAHLQAEMVRYVKLHGVDKSEKQQAKLTVGLVLRFEGPNADDFSIKGTLQQSIPSRPAVITRAVADVTDDGEPALFVRASGSTSDDPRQQVLATEDGRVVDTTTGEVLPEKKAGVKKG